MSDNSQNDSGSQQKPPSPQGFQPKVYVIWLALIGLILMLMYMYPGERSGAQNLEINQVLKMADAGDVTALTIKSDPNGGAQWYKVWGEMKNPALSTKAADADKAEAAPAKDAAAKPEEKPEGLLAKMEDKLTSGDSEQKIPATVPFTSQGAPD